jgi:tRNA(Glu) U13 pseudouridine synthase TruD
MVERVRVRVRVMARVAEKDAGAVQISFCLPQSSYATTFLALMSCE